VRRILATAGVNSPRRRRAPQHRIRRERYPQEGMLLQLDGSRHDWLEGRGPWLTLVAAIDDATGQVPYARFREREDAQGYFLLLREVIRSQGIPLALYSPSPGRTMASSSAPPGSQRAWRSNWPGSGPPLSLARRCGSWG
jgi:hypothetical protein